MEGENIIATEEHPFWVIGKGWTGASDLQAGDILLTQKGTVIRVLGIDVKYLQRAVTVYNFEVKDWHTYYVSDSEILVHNASSLNFAKKVLHKLKKCWG